MCSVGENGRRRERAAKERDAFVRDEEEKVKWAGGWNGWRDVSSVYEQGEV